MPVLVNAYSTCSAPVEPSFPHKMLGQRNRTDPELSTHLDGFVGFIVRGGQREMSQTLYAVMRHVQRVQQHYSFEIDERDLDALPAWGSMSNSILFMADSSVRDPSGAVLVDPKTGGADEHARVPYPADARARKERSSQRCAAQGIQVPEMLPPVIGEGEVVMQEPADVARRTVSLFTCAVRAESIATGEPVPVEQLRERSPLAFESLTPVEAEFLANRAPDQQLVTNMAWRYECLYLLQWALGLHHELVSAAEVCDVPLVAKTMVSRDDNEIVDAAQLRPVDQILEALDLNQRLLWVARQAQIAGNELPAGLDRGVIAERQHALNWLVRFENAEWDDVDTPS